MVWSGAPARAKLFQGDPKRLTEHLDLKTPYYFEAKAAAAVPRDKKFRKSGGALLPAPFLSLLWVQPHMTFEVLHKCVEEQTNKISLP